MSQKQKIQTLPVKFKTADGSEFLDEREALKHQELLEAKEAYTQAAHRFGKLLTEKHKTADGFQFDVTKPGPYYFIRDTFWHRPEIEEVYFYSYYCEYDLNHGLSFKFGEGEKVATYVVSRLYHIKGNAQDALIKAQNEWLERHAEQIRETEVLRARQWSKKVEQV